MKKIFAVLHGDKHTGGDPGMTSNGAYQIGALHKLIPSNPTAVLCGTGRRHHDVCMALALSMTGTTLVIGEPTSLEIIDGERVIVFADGSTCPLSMDRSIADLSLMADTFVRGLEDDTVLCTGRPFLKALGLSDPKSASVILITVSDEGVLSFETLKSLGEIENTN